MKLQKELQSVVEKMEAIKEKIEQHAIALKESGKFKDFETRLAWDCLRAVVGTGGICEWYKQYDCNDSHIETLAKKALKQVYTI